MRTIRLIVEYDGTSFSGWASQPEWQAYRTVQGSLNDGLSRLVKEPIRVRGASRTDAGVHARGQVAAFETTKDNIPLRAFERGMSPLLPPGLVVRRANVVEDRWDPRRTSRGKRYRYTYWNDTFPTALDRERSWFVRAPMDLERMQRGAELLLGTHDFEAFRSAGCDAKHAVRTMYEVKVWRGDYARVHLDVVGNAFVRNMVRIIAGNLREVAVGRMTVDDVARLLESKDRSKGAMTAPPHGLCLEEVVYDDRLPARPKGGRDVPTEPEASSVAPIEASSADEVEAAED